MEHKDSIFISWENASAMIAVQLCKILWKTLTCQAVFDQYNYWYTKILDCRLNLLDITRICDAVHASYDTRFSSFPDEGQSCSSLSMEVSLSLLETYMNCTYEKRFFDKDGLIFINPKKLDNTQEVEKTLKIGNVEVNPSLLKSSAELKKYLSERSATFTSLSDFCEEYQDKFGNQLYWHYPYSDDKHSGLYFVLCSDGILCLPYDQMDGEFFESFKIEDTRFLDADSMKLFIDDWNCFSADLVDAMTSMQEWLME